MNYCVRHLGYTICIVLSLTTACSSRKTSTVSQPPAPEVSPPIDDTTSTPGTDNTNLFDTNTSSDTAPTGGSTISTITQTEQSCLTNNSSLASGGYYAVDTSSSSVEPTTTANSSNICLSHGGNSLSDFYEMGEDSLGGMMNCYERVVSIRPNPTNISANFRGARMALLRCFRRIVQWQMQSMAWQQEQKQSFQTTDLILFLLMKFVSQQNYQQPQPPIVIQPPPPTVVYNPKKQGHHNTIIIGPGNPQTWPGYNPYANQQSLED